MPYLNVFGSTVQPIENLQGPILIQAGSVKLASLDVINDADEEVYIHFYSSVTAAAVVVGTTTPIIVVPVAGAYTHDFGGTVGPDIVQEEPGYRSLAFGLSGRIVPNGLVVAAQFGYKGPVVNVGDIPHIAIGFSPTG